MSGNSITREPAEIQAVEGTPKTAFGRVFRLRESARMHRWTHSNSFWCPLAGWMNRQQQHVIEYLQEEVRVLKEQQVDARPRFTDPQALRIFPEDRPRHRSRPRYFLHPLLPADAISFSPCARRPRHSPARPTSDDLRPRAQLGLPTKTERV